MRRVILLLLAGSIAGALPARAKLPEAEWRKAVEGTRQAYARRDAGEFRGHLETIARDNSTRAVDAIFTALELATELDFYDHAVLLLGRISEPQARQALLRLAERGPDWRRQYAALEAVSGWPGGDKLVLAALASRQPPIRRLAMRLVGDLELVDGIEKMIGMLLLLDRPSTRRSAEAEDLRNALAQLTGQQFDSGKAYHDWWRSLDFVSKSDLLSGKQKKQDQQAKPESPRGEGDGGGRSVAPVMDWLKRRKRDWRYVTTRQKGDILVVPGVFDRVQQVLTHLQIEHTIIARNAVEQLELKPQQILIFNCTRTALQGGGGAGVIMPPGMKLPPGVNLQGLGGASVKLSRAALLKIRRFVMQGGYLFTSDWELANVLAGAFPEYVGVAGYTAQHNYAIRAVKSNWSHPLLRGVFFDGPYRTRKMRWEIDQGSFLIKIKSSRVTPLVWSDPLKKRYSNGLVGVTFSPLAQGSSGKGRVLHVLSHFQKQYTGAEDGYALQKMLLNFIALKQHWRKKPDKPKK